MRTCEHNTQRLTLARVKRSTPPLLCHVRTRVKKYKPQQLYQCLKLFCSNCKTMWVWHSAQPALDSHAGKLITLYFAFHSWGADLSLRFVVLYLLCVLCATWWLFRAIIKDIFFNFVYRKLWIELSLVTMNGWWMCGWMNGWMDVWMIDMDGWMMDGWWMCGWMDWWMDVWIIDMDR